MDNEIKYAGFWRRAIATIIDWLWLYGIIYVSLWLIIGPDIFNPESRYSITQFIFEWMIPLIVVMIFWTLKSATPGKMLLNIKIVDAETLEKVPAPRLFLRYMAYFISMLPLFLGFFWAGFDKKKQGWHDKIAKTVIIKSN